MEEKKIQPKKLTLSNTKQEMLEAYNMVLKQLEAQREAERPPVPRKRAGSDPLRPPHQLLAGCGAVVRRILGFHPAQGSIQEHVSARKGSVRGALHLHAPQACATQVVGTPCPIRTRHPLDEVLHIRVVGGNLETRPPRMGFETKIEIPGLLGKQVGVSRRGRAGGPEEIVEGGGAEGSAGAQAE